MKENGPNSGKRPPAGADNVTIDRNSEETVFIGERTQKVVKLRRSLRSPEENIEVQLFPYNCVKRKGHTQTFGTM